MTYWTPPWAQQAPCRPARQQAQATSESAELQASAEEILKAEAEEDGRPQQDAAAGRKQQQQQAAGAHYGRGGTQSSFCPRIFEAAGPGPLFWIPYTLYPQGMARQ
jgi:hypothetical protein